MLSKGYVYFEEEKKSTNLRQNTNNHKKMEKPSYHLHIMGQVAKCKRRQAEAQAEAADINELQIFFIEAYLECK